MLLDLRYALRRLLARPLLSATAALTLALGVGSAVVMADMLDRLLIRPPDHVARPETARRVYSSMGEGFEEVHIYAVFEAARTAVGRELEDAACYLTDILSLDRGEGARQIRVVSHSDTFFDVLGVQPQFGRLPRDRADAPPEAAISDGLWRSRFGGREDVLGQPITIGTEVYTIVAVLPRGFAGIDTSAADVWLPLRVRAPISYGLQWKQAAYAFRVVARLRAVEGATPAGERTTAAFRRAVVAERPWVAKQRILYGDLTRPPDLADTTRVALAVGGVAVLVLLIACGNVGNILYVRGLRRARELTVKMAIGATRGRLVRELLLEAAVLAVTSGLTAFAFVVTAGTVVRRLFLPTVSALVSPLDWRLITLTAVVCALATLVLGLAPALRLTSKRALAPGAGAMAPPSRLLDLFTGAQVAMTVPLLVGAGLFVVSLQNARGQDLGYATDRVAVISTDVFEIGRPHDNATIHRRMQQTVSPLPGVQAAAVVNQVPLAGMFSTVFSIPGRPQPEGGEMPAMNGVDPTFFDVMRMRLLEGRLFTEAENRKNAPPVAVVTRAMANRYWPGEPALGKCIVFGSQAEGTCTEIIGIVADVRLFPSARPTKNWASALYYPLNQRPDLTTSRALLVRTSGALEVMLPVLRQHAQAAAPNLPFVEVRAFDETFLNLLKPWRLGATIFVLFGLLALVIGAVGLGVITADSVTRRTREIGIRTALGAEPGALVRLMLTRVAVAIAGGLVLGLIGAWIGARTLRSLLFDVAPSDARIFATAVVALVACGLVSAWLPARRAGRLDPVAALRTE